MFQNKNLRLYSDFSYLKRFILIGVIKGNANITAQTQQNVQFFKERFTC